jgi:hypothetical protein
VTKIGKLIFDDSIGLDPFVENPSTLWLLHWYALTAPSELPVWRLLFNDFSGVEFNIEDFANFVDEQISGTSWRIPVQASYSNVLN